MTAAACAALCMWLAVHVHVSAFARVPSFTTPHQLRPLNRHPAVVLLHGGGLQGSPAQQHGSSSEADQEHNSGSEGPDNGDEDGDEPFPIWKGMSAFEAGESEAPPAGVIVVDPFCDYLGKRCIRLLEEAGYAVVQVLSDHLVKTLNNESAKGFRPPKAGKEAEWASCLAFPLVAVICESDAGLANAERLQAALLGPRFGGINDARRDKFLMNEAMRNAGLAAARQVKTGDSSEVRQFLATLRSESEPPPLAPSARTATESARDVGAGGDVGDVGDVGDMGTADISSGQNSEIPSTDVGDNDSNGDGVLSVVKPARGCASGSVFRCRGEDEAMEAFEKIRGTPKYGTPGEFNDEYRIAGAFDTKHVRDPTFQVQTLVGQVLVQEFLVGTEYVVDTVSRDGEHKAVAIWRYDKGPANGAPFVYFSVKLMPSDGEAEQKVVEYAFKALDALGVKFGPTHTEVMMVATPGDGNGEQDSRGAGTPTLVEVNTRWHLTDFAPLTDACVGYNAVDETLSAYLDPERFDRLPRVPPAGKGSRYGRVVHLVSYVEGQLEEIRHEEEIRNLESFAGIDVYADPNNGGSGHVKKTIDIRSDAGWVRLVHDREEVVERDYRRVVELMPTMYRVAGGVLSSDGE